MKTWENYHYENMRLRRLQRCENEKLWKYIFKRWETLVSGGNPREMLGRKDPGWKIMMMPKILMLRIIPMSLRMMIQIFMRMLMMATKIVKSDSLCWGFWQNDVKIIFLVILFLSFRWWVRVIQPLPLVGLIGGWSVNILKQCFFLDFLQTWT